MDMQNGATTTYGSHIIAADPTEATAKRKRKQCDDDGNYLDNNPQPSKRPHLRRDFTHQQSDDEFTPVVVIAAHSASSTSTSHQHAAAASSSTTAPHSSDCIGQHIIHPNSQHFPPSHHPPDQYPPQQYHHNVVAAASSSSMTAVVDDQPASSPSVIVDSVVHCNNSSSSSSNNNTTTGSLKPRGARKPKSPATKAREKIRAKERAAERERERDQFRIGEEFDEAGGAELNSPATGLYAPAVNVVDLPCVSADSVASTAPAAATVADTITTSSFGVGTTKPADLRLCPLPALAWAEAADVWRLMCRKDEKALLDRDPAMLDRHPGIQTRMRAILLDWLMEVCEVYKLHRETYYLAVDYLDRYLTANVRLAKTRLQLIGITCLFTAAKVEEIYPPKIAEFAYVTDGACTEDDIVKQEMMLMLGLNWSINPVTIVGWLSVYMQLNSSNRTPESLNRLMTATTTTTTTTSSTATPTNEGAAFVYPQFSALEFVLAARILDLCTLDVEMAHFQYSVVAAAVLVLTINRTTALRVSGLDWATVKPCVKWMEPFYEVVMADAAHLFLAEQDEQVQQSYGLRHICAHITTDDSHIIQTHTTSVALFEAALKNREAAIALAIRKNKRIAAAQAKKQQQSTPAAQTTSALASCSSSPGGPLTPPDSNRKLNEVPMPSSSSSNSRLLTTVIDAGSAATVAVSDADVAAVGLAVEADEADMQHQKSTVY